jgi:hypothetical protein
MEMGFIQQIKEKEYLYNIEVYNLENVHEQEITKLKLEYREQVSNFRKEETRNHGARRKIVTHGDYHERQLPRGN